MESNIARAPAGMLLAMVAMLGEVERYQCRMREPEKPTARDLALRALMRRDAEQQD